MLKTLWFQKTNNNDFYNKSFSIGFYPQHIKVLQWKNNGAKKGIKEDKCYDLNIFFFGLYIGYTNWSYN